MLVNIMPSSVVYTPFLRAITTRLPSLATIVSVVLICLVRGGHAAVTVDICDDPLCTMNCTQVTKPQGSCIGGLAGMRDSSFLCGNLVTVQTVYQDDGCPAYSDRTSRQLPSNQCVVFQNDPLKYARISCTDNVTMTRIASQNNDCSNAVVRDLGMGSCTNLVGFSGVAFSLLPTCERGLALIRYFTKQNCQGTWVAIYHNQDECVPSQMGDPPFVNYQCPLSERELLCLNLKYRPWYLLSAAIVAFVFSLTLPIMYCCVGCYARRPEQTELATPRNRPELPYQQQAIEHHLSQSEGEQTVLDRSQRTTTTKSVAVATEGQPEWYLARPKLCEEVEHVGWINSISGFSTDTVRGSQYILATSVCTSITLLLLAGANQTLETTTRPDWLMALTALGYASLIITGIVPTPLNRRGRTFHIMCCCSVGGDEGCVGDNAAKLSHTLSAIVFLLLPTAMNIWAAFREDFYVPHWTRTTILVLSFTSCGLTIIYGIFELLNECCGFELPHCSFRAEVLAFCCTLITYLIFVEAMPLFLCIKASPW